MSKVGCYLSLVHLDLGEILNGMPGATLAPKYNLDICFTYRHFETLGDVTGKWNYLELAKASALETAKMPRLLGLLPKALYASRVSNCLLLPLLLPAPPIAKMSDYEDEMDVDAPPVKESIIFSSDNTNAKGKRSAANLPVEAEDNLPW